MTLGDAPNPGLSPARAIACLCFGAALIGLAPIALRFATAEIGPQAVAFWRFAFALIPLGIAAAIIRAPIVRPGLLAGAGVAFGMEVGIWHAALLLTTVANATLFSNMAPIVAALIGWLVFKERIKLGFAAGAGIAVVGAALLSLTAQGATAGNATLWGDVLGLLSAVGYAIYLVILNRARRDSHVVPAMLITTAAAMAVSLGASVALGETLLPQSPQTWLVLIGLGVVVHAGGQGLIALGIGRLPIGVATVLLWVQPVAAAAFAWGLFGESLTLWGLVGAACVLFGIWVVQATRAP